MAVWLLGYWPQIIHHSKEDVDNLERVQRRAAKMLKGWSTCWEGDLKEKTLFSTEKGRT